MTTNEEELAKRRAEEYEMQLFGLHSRTVTVAVEHKIMQNIQSRCEKMYQSILKKYNPEESRKSLLQSNIRHLKRAYVRNMNPHLASVENIIRKFIHIPDNVLLEEDKCQSVQYSDEQMLQIEKRLHKSQENAKRVINLNAALKAEIETLQRISDLENEAKKLCRITENGLSSKKVIPNKVQKALDRSKDLKESLDSFQPRSEKDIFNPRLESTDLVDIIID